MDEQRAARIAVEIAEALIKRDARAASARFGAAMRTGLPEAKLLQMWDGFVATHGAPTARGATEVATRGLHRVAVVRMAFERAPADLRVTIGSDGTVEGLYLVPAASPVEQVRAASRLRRGLLASIPLMAAVIAGYAWLLGAFGEQVALGAAAVGCGGWGAALAMRAPVALAARRGPHARARTLVVAASGPLEEGIRLGALAVTGSTFAAAYSLGLGWAAIEVVYAVVNGFVALTLAGRDDETAEQVRGQLAALGALRPGTNLWGVLERVSASAFHIGATLLIAAQPWLVLLTIVVHSGLNLAAVRLASRSVARAQALAAVVGGVTFAAGLAAMLL